MKSPTYARIAAWKVIADLKMAAHTEVAVEGGAVTIRPRGGQPARVPYGPEDTIDSVYLALKDAVQANTQAAS